jgi:hypothetical protein
MPLTLSPAAGDGVTAPAWRVNVQLPDTGTTITINGTYQAPTLGQAPPAFQTPVAFTTGTISSPGVPGSGTNYWICAMSLTTGALTVTNSTSAIPSPAAGTVVVFQQTLPSGSNAAISLQGGLVFPWL